MRNWKNNLLGSIGDSASPLWAVDSIIRDLTQPQVLALDSIRRGSTSPVAMVTVAALRRRGLLNPEGHYVALSEDGVKVADRIGYLLTARSKKDLMEALKDMVLVSRPSAQGRAIVMVGRDGASQPIYRYRDELSLPEWQQARISDVDHDGLAVPVAVVGATEALLTDDVAEREAERQEIAFHADQDAMYAQIAEHEDALKSFDVENIAAERADLLGEMLAEVAAESVPEMIQWELGQEQEVAANLAETLLGRYRDTVRGSESAASIAMQLDAAIETAYPDIDVNELVAFLATHQGYTVMLAVKSLRSQLSAPLEVLTVQQRKIKYHARKLAELLDSLPDTTVHYAAEQTRPILTTLIARVAEIRTADVRR